MNLLIWVIILLLYFLLPKIRDAIRNNATGVNGRQTPSSEPQITADEYLEALEDRLAFLSEMAENDAITDQQRAELDAEMADLNAEIEEMRNYLEIQAEEVIASQGEAGRSMLDEQEFNQADAQMATSLSDSDEANQADDWLASEDNSSPLQIERLNASPQPSHSKRQGLARLNRHDLKQAVIYSEILSPKYGVKRR